MKVLFAVNNDNVSEAIATKYQKEYKEILSYKNVYYFNAIIRELQKDKSYNRIVISEDLEPFANNNYDMIDKFLLNKYTSISQEAKTLNEERIEIILLGADRRRKSEDILINLFGLEIYNTIIGQDRSIEEVCRLIYSPREKNEARAYYNIPVNELSGQEDGENNVSEAEVENILAHYKRLGRNEDKYVDSFNNIISQYTDTQLKIIIKYLPIHVKAVLEEKSPKYQQLVTSGFGGGGNMNFDLKANKYKQKAQKKSFWKSNKNDEKEEFDDSPLIDREFSKPKMSKPIVIPSDMNTSDAQRIPEPRPMDRIQNNMIQDNNQNPYENNRNNQNNFGRQEPQNINEPSQNQNYSDNMDNQNDFRRQEPQNINEPSQNQNYSKNMNNPNDFRRQEPQSINEPVQNQNYSNNMNNQNDYRRQEPQNINQPSQNQNYSNNMNNQNDYRRQEPQNMNQPNQNQGDSNRMNNQNSFREQEMQDINRMARPEIPQVEPKPIQKPEIENISEIQENEPIITKTELQEPQKVVEQVNPFEDLEQIVEQEENNNTQELNNEPKMQEAEPQPVKRGRGRPRTKPIVEVDPNKPKRGRGRPRKQVPQVENQEIIVSEPEKIEPVQEQSAEMVKPETVQETINQREYQENISPMQEAVNEIQETDLFNMSEEIEQMNPVNTIQNNQDTDVDLFNVEPVSTEDSNNEVDLFNIEEPTPTQQNNNSYNNVESYNTFNEPYTTQNNEEKTIVEETDLFDMANEESTTNSYDINNTMNFEENRQTSYQEETPIYGNNNSEVDLFNIEEPEENDIMTTNRVKTISNLNNLLTSDKKIVAFVGTTKNGTSFVVNNTAEMLASMGISTAVLDMTKSKNSYYIYTNNEEELRNIATKCMRNLENGIPEGLKVNRSLSIYTEMPGEEGKYNIDSVLATLIQSYSAVLIDTDFDTPIEIFERVQEIYLVQTLDVLTIQPLTAFLRNLKSKNILQQEKIKIVINKSQKMRSLNIRTLIGGMSCYNAPNMSYMTELFDKDNVKYCEIPFETQNYIKYLESLVNCSITLNGYTKTLLTSLRDLANMVYPLIGKQSYSPMNGNHKDPFSKQMSSTLNKMRNKGY